MRKNVPGTFIFRQSESLQQTIVLSVLMQPYQKNKGENVNSKLPAKAQRNTQENAINFRFTVKDHKYFVEVS